MPKCEKLGGIMKRAVSVLFAIMFVVATVAAAFAQAPAAPPPGQGRGDGQGRGGAGRGRGPGAPACTTFACDVQADWERNRELFVNISNAMPDDKFSYKSTPAQRSYGEQIMHVIGIDVKLLSTLGGKTPAPMINMQATSKADIMAALRQSMDFGTAVLKEFNDQQLVERVTSMPFMGPTVSRARVIYFSIAHTQDIYGQMAVYLRLNGITPPASNRGGV
jgi:uncharacterized damage-inducible protein DinB